MSTDETEPKGSASSSQDEKCGACGHNRINHRQGTCVICAIGFNERQCTAFAPAEPECPCPKGAWGPEDGPLEPGQDCPVHGDHPEPEAPEGPGPTGLAPCAICGDRRRTSEFKAGLLLCEPCIYSEGQPYCGDCGSRDAPFGLVSREGEGEWNQLRCSKCLLPPRRPPYAVAYALQGGAQYEIALPGDATVRAIDGALIITHDSAILALSSVRPMGAEEQQ